MRISDIPPAYCVSCHKAGPGEEFVDFEAYYDGPVIQEEHYKYQVDDLIICKDCLLDAGKLIGIGDVQSFKQENAEIGEAFQVKLEEIQELHKIINNLQEAVEGLSSDKIMKPEPLTRKKLPKIVEKV